MKKGTTLITLKRQITPQGVHRKTLHHFSLFPRVFPPCFYAPCFLSSRTLKWQTHTFRMWVSGFESKAPLQKMNHKCKGTTTATSSRKAFGLIPLHTQPASQRPCVRKWGESTLHGLYTVLQDPAHDTSAGLRWLRKKSPEGNLSRASSQFNFITVVKIGSCLLKAIVLVWVPAKSKPWDKYLEEGHLFGRLILRRARGRVNWWREVTKVSRGWDLQQVCI